MVKGAPFTPGRVSWVYFSHMDVVEAFEGQGERWNLETGMGRHAEMSMDWAPGGDEDISTSDEDEDDDDTNTTMN